jgi:hypothetical protein
MLLATQSNDCLQGSCEALLHAGWPGFNRRMTRSRPGSSPSHFHETSLPLAMDEKKPMA